MKDVGHYEVMSKGLHCRAWTFYWSYSPDKWFWKQEELTFYYL